jgi:hypothetical protein
LFALTEANVRLVHKNERLEKHGEEDRLAADLNFQYDTDNGVLAYFNPSLRSAFYQASTGPQVELPGTSGPEHLTELKFPEIGMVKWSSGVLIGASLTFHYGVKSRLVLGDARVHKFKFELMAGGTVRLHFQAQVHPGEVESGKLSRMLVDQLCVLTVTPPGEEAGEE